MLGATRRHRPTPPPVVVAEEEEARAHNRKKSQQGFKKPGCILSEVSSRLRACIIQTDGKLIRSAFVNRASRLGDCVRTYDTPCCASFPLSLSLQVYVSCS